MLSPHPDLPGTAAQSSGGGLQTPASRYLFKILKGQTVYEPQIRWRRLGAPPNGNLKGTSNRPHTTSKNLKLSGGRLGVPPKESLKGTSKSLKSAGDA